MANIRILDKKTICVQTQSKNCKRFLNFISTIFEFSQNF